MEGRRVSDVLAASSAAFGTSGLRGLVEDLTDEIVFAAVCGFADLLWKHQNGSGQGGGNPGVLIGHDLRPSSPALSGMVCAALRAFGLEPLFAGAVPTPALALAARESGLSCIMVTGSHIPFDRNGIKFYSRAGEATKLDEAEMLAAPARLLPHSLDRSLPPVDASVESGYRARFSRLFPDLLNGMRIGLYQHSAVGRDLTTRLFKDLGADVVALGRSDTFVPIDTEAVSKADGAQCRAWVRQHRLDAVFSTDGDGDRPLLSDEQGNYFRGDVLGILTARYLGIQAVATPVSSNSAVEKSGWFSQVLRTKIGSPHVLAAMAELRESGAGPVAGFEANGGFLTETDVTLEHGILSALPTRDAVLPAISVLALMKSRNEPLSAARALLPPCFTVSGRLQNRPTQASAEFVSALSDSAEAQNELVQLPDPVVRVDRTDGLRMISGEGEIVHLRPSGNAPEFRIYVEASSPERAQVILEQVTEKVADRLPAAAST